MAIAAPDKLLIDYNIYKQYNGFILPKINDDDIENGLTTPELKFQAWSFYTQEQLNQVVQEELDNVQFDLNLIAPEFQKSIIRIMIARLNRAFYNDEIIPRDSQVQVSQSGDISYSSTGTIDPKSAKFSFWNGSERAMIENSGILTDNFASSSDDIEQSEIIDNQFKSGEFVPEVDLNEFQRVAIVVNGVNTTVLAAIQALNTGKQDKDTLIDTIAENTGLTTTAVEPLIETLQGKYISYPSHRQNKGANELAQVQDITESEARSKAEIVNTQNVVNILSNNDHVQDERLELLESIEYARDIVYKPDAPISIDAGNGDQGFLNIAGIEIDNPFYDPNIPEDPVTNPAKIKPFTDFDVDSRWTVEIYDPSISATGAHSAKTFTRDHSGLYTFANGAASDSFKFSINENGYAELLRTNGNTNVEDLRFTEIILRTSSETPSDQRVAIELKKKVTKQLVQAPNGDFANIADLRNLIDDDDFVSITLDNGYKITGRVDDSGSPIIIDGHSRVNALSKYGDISIADDGTVTGGKKISLLSEFYFEKRLEWGKWYKIVSTGDGEYIVRFETGHRQGYIGMVDNKPDQSKLWVFTANNDSTELNGGTTNDGYLALKSENGDGLVRITSNNLQIDEGSLTVTEVDAIEVTAFDYQDKRMVRFEDIKNGGSN